ncbi:MAG: hypothetical protein OEW77_05905 [Gemmatimonadota bacterium]|nr:hypothetical protein [Gemmatimonadota bacterium]
MSRPAWWAGSVLLVCAAVACREPQVQGFPLEINGQAIAIARGISRDSVTQALRRVFKEEPTATGSADRIQYDAQLVPDQAPVSLVFEFDTSGSLTHVILDGYMEQQNPPVRTLVAWLDAHAGKATVTGTSPQTEMVWSYGGWTFTHTAGGDGQDATYAMRIDPGP